MFKDVSTINTLSLTSLKRKVVIFSDIQNMSYVNA